mmetsp:Transcript_38865/g.39552  ORF Transcript_38865/g.39552 Transcript_38865/m.39552 type:complete len:93 (-) Transcript_38865:23-301(-)
MRRKTSVLSPDTTETEIPHHNKRGREREKERERERERGLFRSKEVRSQFSRVVGLRKLTPSSPHDKQLMDDIGHYAVYAMASYSILMLSLSL